jgi:hypothetical protein
MTRHARACGGVMGQNCLKRSLALTDVKASRPFWSFLAPNPIKYASDYQFTAYLTGSQVFRLCEEQRDEAIHLFSRLWIAASASSEASSQ